jgi:predicted acyl esterase
MHSKIPIIGALLLVSSFASLSAAPATYARKDEMIPMCDGVRLHTRIFNPLSMWPWVQRVCLSKSRCRFRIPNRFRTFPC